MKVALVIGFIAIVTLAFFLLRFIILAIKFLLK